MLRHAPFLERARTERERERDLAARLAVAAYVVARLVDRLLEGVQGEDMLEAFAWQTEAVRRHLSDLPGDAPEAAHLLGIVDAVVPTGRAAPGLRLSLTAYAYFLEHEARLIEALDVLELSARTHGDQIPAGEFSAIALFAGRLRRLLALWGLANASYSAAEEAAHATGDPVTVLRSRLGRCGVLRAQGNLPASRALAESVLRSAEESGLRDVQAMAYADLGAVLVLQGLFAESVQAKYRAFLFTEDGVQRMRVLGDLGVGLAQIGATAAARTAFEIVVASQTGFLVRMNALLELMDLESQADNRVAFERLRAEAESIRERMTPSMLADFMYKSGVGLARFGRLTRARDVLTEGLRLTEANGLNAWYFRFERTLQGLSGCALCDPQGTQPLAPAGLSDSPAIQEVALGLREYALSTA